MKITKRQLRKIIKEYGHDDYVVHPTDYVKGAMELLTPEEFNGIGIEKMTREAEYAAQELRDRWPEDEGFGSSDRTYELQGFLEMLGFKTGWSQEGYLEVVRDTPAVAMESKVRALVRKKILKEQFGGLDEDSLYRFNEIMQEIQELTREALDITRQVPDGSIHDRARAYWYGHIMKNAGSDEYHSSYDTTMSSTYEELEEFAEYLDEDGNNTEDY